MFIVKKTMQYFDKESGEKVFIVSSSEPQILPKALVSEAIKRGLAVAVEETEESTEAEGTSKAEKVAEEKAEVTKEADAAAKKATKDS